MLVHRKGATRAFPAGSEEIPAAYREAGQPVFIPGSMGTASYVLAGDLGSLERSFGTTCHGAGRRLSRTAARKEIAGADLRRQLQAQGIVVRSASNKGLAEEAPFAYKDVFATRGVPTTCAVTCGLDLRPLAPLVVARDRHEVRPRGECGPPHRVIRRAVVARLHP